MAISLSAYQRRPLHQALGLFALLAATLLYSPAYASADVIRLNNGSVINGQIIRDDDSAVVILVSGTPQFYPADDVSAIIYSRMRLDPRSSKRRASAGSSTSQALMDSAIVDKIRERLLTYHGFFIRVGTVSEYLRWKDMARAGVASQRAAKWILPVERGIFNPFSALADVLILFGLRVPVLWLALALAGQARGIIRIAEFIVPAYGFLMLMMTYVTVTGILAVQLLLFPLAIAGVAWLFMWMFVLSRGRALLAFSITLAINAGVEAVLVHSQWLSVGLQNQLLQLAQR